MVRSSSRGLLEQQVDGSREVCQYNQVVGTGSPRARSSAAIGDMSARTQAKVLRVLQNGEVEPVGAEKTVQVRARRIWGMEVPRSSPMAKPMRPPRVLAAMRTAEAAMDCSMPG